MNQISQYIQNKVYGQEPVDLLEIKIDDQQPTPQPSPQPSIFTTTLNKVSNYIASFNPYKDESLPFYNDNK